MVVFFCILDEGEMKYFLSFFIVRFCIVKVEIKYFFVKGFMWFCFYFNYKLDWRDIMLLLR